MAIRLGNDAKLFYNTTGVSGGTWVEGGNVRDLSQDRSTALADTTTRDNNGYRAQVATLKEFTITFQMLYDPDNQMYTDFASAYNAKTQLGIRAFDGPLDNATGIETDMLVSNFSQSEGLEEAITIDVTLVNAGTPVLWEDGSPVGSAPSGG